MPNIYSKWLDFFCLFFGNNFPPNFWPKKSFFCSSAQPQLVFLARKVLLFFKIGQFLDLILKFCKVWQDKFLLYDFVGSVGLQYITIHSNTKQHTTKHNNTQQYTTIWQQLNTNAPQYTTIHNNIQQFMTIHNNTQQFCLVTRAYCQAQPQLNSTQLQLNLRQRLALFPAIPATHPATQPPSHDSSF